MKSANLILVLSLILSNTIFSQSLSNNEDNEAVILEEQIHQNKALKEAVESINRSHVSISQDGVSNTALIDQNIQNQINYIEVDQQGTGHFVDLDVRGTDNGIRIEQKQGMGTIPDLVDAPSRGHRYSGDIYGNENLINIKQTGNGNSIRQTATVDNLNMDVHQSGHSNELTLINNTVSAPPVQIHQSGHDMNITIENNVMPIQGIGK